MTAVIGAGPAGCFFLACLPPERLSSVWVFERGCIGGDLSRLYGEVVANLTRTEMCRAFRTVPQWSHVPLPILDKYAEDSCPLLADVCLQLRILMKPILAQVKFYAEDVHEIRQVVGGWILKTDTTTHEFQQVVLCTGADPRILQYPKPSIPLEIALSPSILRSYLQGGERIVVFGTSHSGTLILRNLRRIGCRTTAVYRGVPFRWARNHDPEGLKQESATIADEIVGHAWGSDTPTLLPLESNVELVRAIMEADYIIYATGFERRHPMLRGMDGSPVGTFDPTTALIAPGMWGFGIAFPALYEMPRGGQAPDIGFQGFVSQILKCLPGIL
jgi:hypothetical protein